MNRIATYLAIGFVLITAPLFLNCSNGSGSSDGNSSKETATGEVALALVWETPDSAETNIRPRALAPVFNEDGTLDCENSQIDKIYVHIYNQNSGASLANNGAGWPCSAHEGVVKNVPPSKDGTDYRKLVCLARDKDQNVIFRGQQADIQISSNNTERVQVKMATFTTDPSGMEDGAQTSDDTLTFQCSTVPNASGYHLQVATDEGFTNVAFEETSATTAIPTQFTTSNTYFWRICAVDMYGQEGAWTTPRTVTVTLPPLVTITPASQITKTSAALNATVDPRGLSTTYWFEYRPADDPNGAWIQTAEAELDAQSAAKDVSAPLENIATETTFEFRLTAVNSAGQTTGEPRTFTTGDAKPPEISEHYPENGAVNESVQTAIWARFTEDIDESTLTPASFWISDGTSKISGTITYENMVAYFEPTATVLKTDTTYYVTLTTAIKDMAGNPLLSETIWSFTTTETLPPEVLSTYPKNGARGVQIFPTITATFNEPMSVDTINQGTFTVYNGMDYIGGTVSYDEASLTATFIPDEDLDCNATFTVTITTGAQDITRNAMETAKSWQFETTNKCGAAVSAAGYFYGLGIFAGHSLALKMNGTLWAWGYNSSGQLGDGTNENKNIPTQVGADNDWAVMAAGGQHTIALKKNGTLWAWGANYAGQLGLEETIVGGVAENKNTPTRIGEDKDWAAITAGGRHTIALKTDGTLWAWGDNWEGQLGDGTNEEKNTPTQIGEDKNWAAITAGGAYTIALKTDGTLWAWGYNYNGQLGDGTNEDKNIPTKVGKDDHWATISAGAGSGHTLALKTDGTLWAWGNNSSGQLGDETSESKNVPTQIGSDNDWKSVCAGTGHSLALKRDNSLSVWGENEMGQLGDGTYEDAYSPTRMETNVDLVAGGFHTLVAKSDGTLWAWGLNDYGQLGDGTYELKRTPTQVISENDWVDIAPAWHSSFALKSNGTLWAWGDNSSNTLGNGTYEDIKKPEQIGTDNNWAVVKTTAHTGLALKNDGTLWQWGGTTYDTIDSPLPTQIGTDNDWVAIEMGEYNRFALKSDGTLWAWGRNEYGELGDGTNEPIYSPTQIGTDNKWESVRIGYGHTVALKADETLWAWGENYSGQIGDGTNENRNSPVQIGIGERWKAVQAVKSHNLALTINGTLWAWGDNSWGQLGTGTFEDNFRPTQIGSDKVWTDVYLEEYFTLALTNEGTLWAWGYNPWRQPGNGTNVPTQIGTDNDWATTFPGNARIVQKSDGTLWAWGDDFMDWISDGTNEILSTPAQIGTDKDWAMVQKGDGYVLALKTNNSLWAWGFNAYYQLGDGTTEYKDHPVLINPFRID